MMEELLPENLRIARMERGLSLRKAAELTGVTKETLSDLERGVRKPQPPTLFKIAKGYAVPVRDLLGADSPKDEAPHSPEISVEERRQAALDAMDFETLAVLLREYEKSVDMVRRALARKGVIEGWTETEYSARLREQREQREAEATLFSSEETSETA